MTTRGPRGLLMSYMTGMEKGPQIEARGPRQFADNAASHGQWGSAPRARPGRPRSRLRALLGATSTVPAMRHGFGTYFAPAVGLWDDIQLIRDDARARGAIDAMGEGAGLLMRGNGAVTAGASLQEATVLAWYLEDMCRVELAVRAAGLAGAPAISQAEASQRATRAGRIVERMWDHLTAADPETGPKEKGGAT